MKKIFRNLDWGMFTVLSLIVGVVVFMGVVFYEAMSHIPNNVTSTETFEQIFRTEFDGHTYIVFKTNGGIDKYDMSGVVHDPDCKCFDK